MSDSFKAYAASARGAKLEPFEFNPGPLRDDQVEIEVESCGICHSDLSMLDNDWGQTVYPFVPGYEVDHLRSGKARYRIVLQNDLG